MRFPLFLLFSLLLAGSTVAQNYQAGYLLTLEGDTIQGMVAEAANGNFAFKEDRNSSRRFYHEDELFGFNVGESGYEKHVVEVLMGNFPEKRKVFLKLLVNGPLKLMEYEGEGLLFGNVYKNHFLYHPESEVPWRIPAKEKQFKSQMSRYFSDVPDLAARIKSKELGYDNLEEIVQIYNAWSLANPIGTEVN